MSIREGDGPERGACCMAEMWNSFESSFRRAPQEPRIRIKARMAASLTYDTFLRRHIYTAASKGTNAAADKGLWNTVRLLGCLMLILICRITDASERRWGA
jgi:hypothetical protein